MFSSKKEIKEPILDDELYDGGKKKKKGDGEGDEIECKDLVGGQRNVKLIYLCAIVCVGVFLISYAMRTGEAPEDAMVGGDDADLMAACTTNNGTWNAESTECACNEGFTDDGSGTCVADA